jgi:hypothetical protein
MSFGAANFVNCLGNRKNVIWGCNFRSLPRKYEEMSFGAANFVNFLGNMRKCHLGLQIS